MAAHFRRPRNFKQDVRHLHGSLSAILFLFVLLVGGAAWVSGANISTASSQANTTPRGSSSGSQPKQRKGSSRETTPPIEVTTCGGVARGSKGILQTPNFPAPFKVPLRCRWIIDASNSPGASIVVYLTQVFVTSGLRFESFAYLDADGGSAGAFGGWSGGGSLGAGGGSPVGRQLILNSDSRPPALEEVGWIRSESPFLVATLNLDRLEGSHIRDLGPLLHVYGLNVTYELIPKSDSVRAARCSLLECSVAGHCYGQKDLGAFYCSCFDGFFGEHCEYSRLCDPMKNASQCYNGGRCRHVGSTAIRCECPKGFSGLLCQNRVIGGGDVGRLEDCPGGGCSGQCPFDGRPESVCNCPGGSKPAGADRARFEGSIRLANVTQLRAALSLSNPTRTLEAALEKQLTKFMKLQNLTKVEDVKVNNISDDGEVSFSFLAGKGDGLKVREGLIRLVEKVRLGSLSLVPTRLDYRQEPALLLQSVLVDQEKIILGGEYTASCVAQGSPLMEFRWYKDGMLVNHSRATRHMWQRLLGRDTHDSYTALLRVSGAAAEDDGELWCHVSDGGRQQCGAVKLKVAGPPPTASVRPKAVTLLKGENVSLVCMSPSERRRHPDRLGFFWTKNNALLPLTPGKEVMEDLYPSGSILHIYGAQHSATYSCHVVGGAVSPTSRPHSFAVHVAVVDPSSVPLCPSKALWGVQWPRTAPGQRAITDCPTWPVIHFPKSQITATQSSDDIELDLSSTTPETNDQDISEALIWSSKVMESDPGGGEAGRECTLKETGIARWEDPDFSGCIYEPLTSIQGKFRRLTLGYETTTPTLSLEQLSDFLFTNLPASGSAPSLLPGQGEPAVTFLAEVQAYLYLRSEIKRHAIELNSASPLLFYSIDLLMRHHCAIKNFQKTTQVILLTIRQSLLWAHVLATEDTAPFSYPAFQEQVSYGAYMSVAPKYVNSHSSVQHSLQELDDSALLIYIQPISSSAHGSLYNEYRLLYPGDVLSYPSWFSDKVEAWITASMAATVMRNRRGSKTVSREELSESVSDQEHRFNATHIRSSLHSDIPTSWSLIAFKSLAAILPQRYVARTRDGSDMEYEIGSRIITLGIGSQSGYRLHEMFQHPSLMGLPHTKKEHGQHHSGRHSFAMHLSIEFSLTSVLPSPSDSSSEKIIWNVTCGKFITGAVSDDLRGFISAPRGHTWKLDACTPIPSPAVEAEVSAWLGRKTSSSIWNSESEPRSGERVVTCHCDQPGTYAILFVMKKLAKPWEAIGQITGGIDVSNGGWWILLPNYGGPPGAKGVTGTGCGVCLALSLFSLLSLLCLRPSIKLLLKLTLCIKKPAKQQVHNSSCPPRCTPLNQRLNRRHSSLFHLPSCLHLLKIQCCASVFGAMAVFLYAMQSTLPKSSYPYVTTCLEGFLLTGMSSHLSKVLIVYAEVVTAASAAEIVTSTATAVSTVAVEDAGDGLGERIRMRGAASPVVARRLGTKTALSNIPQLSHLRPTILGIVTGIPVLTVLATHLSHQTSGWDLPSWWLVLGSSLFNVFIAAAILITLLFAFLCASLLKRLRNLLIIITKPQHITRMSLSSGETSSVVRRHLQKTKAQGDVRIIKRRVAFLKRAAAIFSSMVVMETASVLYINIPDDAVTHYLFSISSAWLGMVIFVCYVVKSETPLGPCKLFRSLKEKARGKRRIRSGENNGEVEDNDYSESDYSDSLDSPLTLFTNPCPVNDGGPNPSASMRSGKGAMDGRVIDLVECGKRGGGDGACSDAVLFSVTEGAGEVENKDGVDREMTNLGILKEGEKFLAEKSGRIESMGTAETYVEESSIPKEETFEPALKQALPHSKSSQARSHCIHSKEDGRSEKIDAVLLYSEWKQQEMAVKQQKPNVTTHSHKGSCDKARELEENRGKVVAKETVGIKTMVEVNTHNDLSCDDPTKQNTQKTIVDKLDFPSSSKLPPSLKKTLKIVAPPKIKTFSIEKVSQIPNVLEPIKHDLTKDLICDIESTSKEMTKGPDLLAMQESFNRIPLCIKDESDVVESVIINAVNPVSWTHSESMDPVNDKCAIGDKGLINVVLSNKLQEEKDVELCALGSKQSDNVKNLSKTETVVQTIPEIRRCPDGREELSDDASDVIESGLSDGVDEVAGDDGEEGNEDMDGMLDRISQDLDFLLNRTQFHGESEDDHAIVKDMEDPV